MVFVVVDGQQLMARVYVLLQDIADEEDLHCLTNRPRLTVYMVSAFVTQPYSTTVVFGRFDMASTTAQVAGVIHAHEYLTASKRFPM